MNRIIRIFTPADPPFIPMNFTRMPVVHRFWYGGLVAALAGFVLGFGLWTWQHGYLLVEWNYFLVRLWHARIQIEGFVGSFLLGFALQSGPHVAGGQPPPSSVLLQILPVLWAGLLLSLSPYDPVALVGQVLVSGAYGAAGYFLLRVTLGGNPMLRVPRGIPLAAGITLMATTPWLELDDPGIALFILWCGPVTVAMVAGQQLINNVLGGRVLQGSWGIGFTGLTLLAWLLSAMAAFHAQGSWRLAALAWLAQMAVLLAGTGFVPALRNAASWLSIHVTLTSGLAFGLASALVLLAGEGLALQDVALHLLAAGMLTTLIVGVSVRVAGFFSAGAVLPDQLTSYLLLLWAVVAGVRSLSPLLPMEEYWTVALSLLGMLLLLVWGGRTAYRLTRIHRLLPAAITGKKS
ncbi:MAG: NnrS family protein [Magnetococcales bacterium]|nr:NnrS family protein [Magnetococcales bacterium]